MKDNFGFKHKAGILMAVSSLPSPYGIGSMGKPALDFVDFLAATKQKCWQVLPLNPTAYGDSPYQSPASMAGNPYFIDLDILYRDGLISDIELQSAIHPSDKVDYGWLFNTRITLLWHAFIRFRPTGAYRAYKRANAGWLDDYALFMTLKQHYSYAPWTTWLDKHKFYTAAVAECAHWPSFGAIGDLCGMVVEFWHFVQYQFDTQWNKVLSYAHQKGIKIIGDMPIYVAYDSVEVWSNSGEYLLDENLTPTLVAGCPPDGFSPDGQLWGNPIYNWSAMQESGFAWWVSRVKRCTKLYDIVRIDHFRGFAGYYVVRFGESTARDGWWQTGVGTALFDTIADKVPSARIIAEDLGFITDDVRELLDHTGFPGMKILQFAFYDEDSEYLPRMYTTDNCIVYTGSHDAEATKHWCDCLEGKVLTNFNNEVKRKGRESRTHALIRLALNSRANLAIIPLQDYMELGDESRMNTPSEPMGNWCWRVEGYNTAALRKRVRDLVICTKRATK